MCPGNQPVTLNWAYCLDSGWSHKPWDPSHMQQVLHILHICCICSICGPCAPKCNPCAMKCNPYALKCSPYVSPDAAKRNPYATKCSLYATKCKPRAAKCTTCAIKCSPCAAPMQPNVSPYAIKMQPKTNFSMHFEWFCNETLSVISLFQKVITLRCVFEGTIAEVRQIAATLRRHQASREWDAATGL